LGELLKKGVQIIILVVVAVQHFDRLRNVAVDCQASAHSVLFPNSHRHGVVVTELAGQVLNLSRPCGAEEKSLSVGVGDIAGDLLDVLLKAHV